MQKPLEKVQLMKRYAREQTGFDSWKAWKVSCFSKDEIRNSPVITKIKTPVRYYHILNYCWDQIVNLCQLLFCENMVMPFINPLTTYNGNKETIKQTHQNNG